MMKIVRLLLLFLCLLSFDAAFARGGRKAVYVDFRLEDGSYYAFVCRKLTGERDSVYICKEEAVNALPTDHKLYEPANAKKAYQTIIAPLGKYIARGQQIIFSPAGRIHFINLSALLCPDGRRCLEKYDFVRVSNIYAPIHDRPKFINRCSLNLFGGMNYYADTYDMYENIRCWTDYYPSFKNLLLSLDQRPRNTDRLYLGRTEDGTRAGFDNLKWSKEEIKYIYYKWTFAAAVHTGPKAIEELFYLRTMSTDPYIMHLSTHTFTSDLITQDLTQSMHSRDEIYRNCGLLFSGAGHSLDGKKLNGCDGFLYADEIAGLDMASCELVVLAACNTALGVITQDGILGIQSAFKDAGVKGMLLTLWSVNDKATSEFMKSFYTHLFAGKSRHDAFKLARHDMMKSKDFNDPIYWAPFIMLD